VLQDCLIGFPIWMGVMILRDLLPEQNRGGHVLLTVVMFGGLFVWFASLRRFVRLSQLLHQDQRLASVLNDELIVANRAKAALFTVFALAGLQGLSIVLLAFAPRAISALVLAEINVLVSVTAFIGAFLYLDQKAQ
jgi:hypothetical protein